MGFLRHKHCKLTWPVKDVIGTQIIWLQSLLRSTTFVFTEFTNDFLLHPSLLTCGFWDPLLTWFPSTSLHDLPSSPVMLTAVYLTIPLRYTSSTGNSGLNSSSLFSLFAFYCVLEVKSLPPLILELSSSFSTPMIINLANPANSSITINAWRSKKDEAVLTTR